MKNTVVTATRCPLFREPSRASEQLDELLLGWSAEILDYPAPGWWRVRSEYGYEGYAPAASLCADERQSRAFAVLPKRVVTRSFCTVLAAPKVQSWPVAELTRGALVSPLGRPDENGWVKVALPGGAEGYVKRGDLGLYRTVPTPDEAAFRKAVAGSALTYLDAPYRWGGKSPLGLDCSGLAFMAYRLNGVTICRDARLEEPVRPIPREEMKRGDLLYFPGHMAVYLGGGVYIHATARDGSDGVVLNSLDPAAPNYREDLAQSLKTVGSIF